jgi:hypothetical protein
MKLYYCTSVAALGDVLTPIYLKRYVRFIDELDGAGTHGLDY